MQSRNRRYLSKTKCSTRVGQVSETYAESVAKLTPAYIEKMRIRFMAKVEIQLHPESVLETPCWLWTGSTHYKGYGEFRVGKRKVKAHRLALVLFGGKTDTLELVTDHICRVRACCNPQHLEFKTTKANIFADGSLALAKGLREKTHCVAGHEFTDDNTYMYKGHRACRKCHYRRSMAYWHKKQSEAKRAAGDFTI